VLSVGELLGELGLEPLAGSGALEQPIRWVHLSELSDPTAWLSGGEVLLSTGMALREPDAQRKFVARLAAHGLSALGFGLGLAFDEVPAAVIETATELGFPVFAVPYELPFIAITELAFTRLVNDQYALLQRALRAQERLERAVLAGRGLDAVVTELSGLIGGSVAVLDGHGARIAGGGVTGLDRGLALTVDSSGARLVAEKPVLSDFDRLLLRQAVTIVALELLRARVAGETERRLAGDVLQALVAGELSGADLARRLAPFGLGETVACLVSSVPIGGALAEVAMVASVGALECALIGGRSSEEELFELASRVAESVGASVGVGRAVAAGDARRTFHEARCALEAVTLGISGAALDGGPKAANYRDLGSFQLLLALQDDEALALYCDSILGAISGGGYGDELLRSLEAFIEENGQWERAARRLYCHRHTLRYRIRKVEELTGRDLGSARDRIEFWLALRGRELVSR
jgi:PucR family transcriptional regulator, purine catabolism regulatory protein